MGYELDLMRDLERFEEIEDLLDRRVISDEIDRFLVFAGFDEVGNPVEDYAKSFRSLRKEIRLLDDLYVIDVSEIRVVVSKYDLSTKAQKRVYYNEIELFTHQTRNITKFVSTLEDILNSELSK